MCKSKIILCTCRNRGRTEQSVINSILDKLQTRNVHIVELEDFCDIAVTNTSVCKSLLENSECIIACSEKAIKAILDYINVEKSINIKGVNTETEEELLKYIDSLDQGDATKEIVSASDSWNPFIERSLCTNCGQCYEFCIFKVYSKNEKGEICITNPSACKDNCPACARLCPQGAIVFPKHPEPSINGSAEPIEPDNIFDGDIYKAFANRNINKIFKDDI
ncbi:MAG: hypothetical protein PF692_14625 [Kiritimatiellae bacterium]|jgi:NAD-dependent dihydropyrimidine dehydrogenase PreA subunit|nr:hypothetical protein [Kiritimatiellia bacterium]